MKRNHIIISLVAIISILVAAIEGHRMSVKKSLDTSIWDNAELLASGEAPACYNGGVGASSCSIESGIDVFGLGISSKCEVTCISGYYACCGLRCICVKYQ